eukprot:GHVQ01031730.1.p1 GENE.GHVQ01031730.1~~GHVQ01031730.1.p1  ORF type:complete len:132 (-),score=19.17 GHVQ01031730.1:437-832(-)
MVERLNYRSHCHYNTKSNKVRKVKTPGGKLVFQNLTKKAQRPKCGDCKKPLNGIPALRPYKYSLIPKHDRTVSRAYGGSRCHQCVRQRILRAFLVEEQKCVRQVLLEKEKQKKDELKAEARKKSKKASKKP